MHEHPPTPAFLLLWHLPRELHLSLSKPRAPRQGSPLLLEAQALAASGVLLGGAGLRTDTASAVWVQSGPTCMICTQSPVS